MEASCVRCGKAFERELARCPYCTVVQPKSGGDPRKSRPLLWLALAGLAAGFAGGGGLARRPERPGRPFFLGAPRSREDPSIQAYLRSRYEDERRRLRAAEVPVADADRLAIGPETYAGRTIAIAGYCTFLGFDGGRTRACLATQWAGGRAFDVDVSALAPRLRAELMRAPARRMIALAVGRWGAMPTRYSSLGYGLTAERLDFLGPAPPQRVAGVEELLGRGGGGR